MADGEPMVSSLSTSRANPLKLVMYRPHANIWFRNTVGRILKRTPLPNKYAPLLDYLLSSSVSLSFASDLSHPSTVIGFLKRLRDGFELLLWCVLNRISLRKINFVFSRNALADKDVLFLMHYGNLTSETEKLALSGLQLALVLAEIHIPKAVHLTHYAYCAASGSRNLAALRPGLLIAENNLARNSPYYQKYFGKETDTFYCLPYVSANRFLKRKPLAQRINKLVVTGSITYKMKNPEFIEFYQANELQPLRRRLYEQAAGYMREMDCLISDLAASRVPSNMVSGNKPDKPGQQHHPSDTQRDYYKKDIVDIYNAYTMFAVPEEICDLPAIGFVEGMACGTAYLGIRSPMYEDIGLVAGVHYIGYDGTVSDLMAKVSHYQEHPLEVERIAQEGYRFVRQQLSAQTVFGAFVERLRELSKDSRGGR